MLLQNTSSQPNLITLTAYHHVAVDVGLHWEIADVRFDSLLSLLNTVCLSRRTASLVSLPCAFFT